MNNRGKAYVRQYKIDGDVISDPQIVKCDYLVLNDNDNEKAAFFIELKVIFRKPFVKLKIFNCYYQMNWFHILHFTGSCIRRELIE